MVALCGTVGATAETSLSFRETTCSAWLAPNRADAFAQRRSALALSAMECGMMAKVMLSAVALAATKQGTLGRRRRFGTTVTSACDADGLRLAVMCTICTRNLKVACTPFPTRLSSVRTAIDLSMRDIREISFCVLWDRCCISGLGPTGMGGCRIRRGRRFPFGSAGASLSRGAKLG